MAVTGCGTRWDHTKAAKAQGIQPRLLEIKQWREQEHNAGRSSSLEDWFRAQGLCFACKAGGTDLTPTGFDGEVWLFSDCAVCGGTGKIE
jgi:hypothetical protein